MTGKTNMNYPQAGKKIADLPLWPVWETFLRALRRDGMALDFSIHVMGVMCQFATQLPICTVLWFVLRHWFNG